MYHNYRIFLISAPRLLSLRIQQAVAIKFRVSHHHENHFPILESNFKQNQPFLQCVMNRKMQEKIFRKATNVEITFIFLLKQILQ
jgi:hypothetical protein